MVKHEKYTCDVCGAECTESSRELGVKMQVIFTTEQDEGRAVDPYLVIDQIDICRECQSHIVETRQYIVAAGAMGYNEYHLEGRTKN